MIDPSLELLAGLFVVASLAGWVDAIAGGGGLIVLPALLTTGLPPALVLGTNKLQASFGSFSASLAFIRRGVVEPRRMAPLIAATFVGSLAGTLLVAHLDPRFLKDLIPLLLIALALYTLIFGGRLARGGRARIADRPFTALCGTGLGFYDGFLGPGTGSFWALAFATLKGFDLRLATAHAKIVNFASNLASLACFAALGVVSWKIGLVMAVGQFLGARVGASLVLRDGARIIRPMIVLMSLAITTRLVLTDQDNWLYAPAVRLLAAVGIG